MSGKFNQKQYIMDYKKEHKKTISIDLNIDESEELNEMVTKLGITKVQVLRKGMEEYKKELDAKE